MPISATLYLPNTAAIQATLRTWPSFAPTYEKVSPDQGDASRERRIWRSDDQNLLFLDVTQFLLLRDLYHHRWPQTTEDKAFWAQNGNQEVLLPGGMPEKDGLPEIIPSYFATILGELNVPFLRWIEQLAISSQVEISLYYEHERGDSLYESAKWIFYPANSRPILEELHLTDDAGDLRAAMLRMANGTILKEFKKPIE